MTLFKIYIVRSIKSDEVLEVYKFNIDLSNNDGRNTLLYLGTTIQNEIPYLQGKNFKIYWKDDENDMVNVHSDNCVRNFFINDPQQLLRMVPAPKLFRLYIEPEAPKTGNSDVVHAGVSCDGCDIVPIVGLRYKCLQCPEYDLCEGCEKNGIHGTHSMIRFTAAPAWPNINRTPLNKYLKRRFISYLSQNPEMLESTSEEEAAGTCPFMEKKRRHCYEKGAQECGHEAKGHGHKGKGHGHEGKGHGHEGKDHGNHDSDRVRGWRRRCYVRNPNGTAGDYIRLLSSAAAGAAASTASAAGAAAGGSQAGAYLIRDIGQAVAGFLDPLGIRVELKCDENKSSDKAEVKTAEKPQEASKEGANASQQPSAVPPQPSVAAFANLAEHLSQVAPGLAQSVQQITESLARQQVSENNADDWTVINESGREASPQNIAPTSSNGVRPAPVENAAQAAELRRVLQASAPAPPVVSVHPNPRIQEGVSTLQAMGFSNENGILTQILEIHNGDLIKALDILAVLPKQ